MNNQLHNLRQRLAGHHPVAPQVPAVPAHIPTCCGTTGHLAGGVVVTHGKWPASDDTARLIGAIAFDLSRSNF